MARWVVVFSSLQMLTHVFINSFLALSASAAVVMVANTFSVSYPTGKSGTAFTAEPASVNTLYNIGA